MKPVVLMTDSDARLALPRSFAQSFVVVEVDDAEEAVTIRKVTVQGMSVGSTPTATHNTPTSTPATGTPRATGSHTTGSRTRELPVSITQTRSGKILIEGQPYTRFLKSLGMDDWDNADAAKLFGVLAERTGFHHLKEVAEKSTISCQVGDGRKMRRGEQPSHSGLEPTPLTSDQLKALRRLISKSVSDE